MTTWILYLLLANGEATSIGVAPEFCRYIPIAIEAGHPVHADYYGDRVEITRAACHGPVKADPCEMEALS